MLKRTVTYNDPFEGHEVTEDLYFNLTAAELTKMVMVEGEDFGERLQGLSTATQGKEIVAYFDKLLGAAYGRREGNQHLKSPEITQAFLSSEAYSTLFLELISEPDSGADFFNNMLPKDLDKIVAKMTANQTKGNQAADPDDKRPAWIREDREPTQAELSSMTKAQLVEVMQRKNK